MNGHISVVFATGLKCFSYINHNLKKKTYLCSYLYIFYVRTALASRRSGHALHLNFTTSVFPHLHEIQHVLGLLGMNQREILTAAAAVHYDRSSSNSSGILDDDRISFLVHYCCWIMRIIFMWIIDFLFFCPLPRLLMIIYLAMRLWYFSLFLFRRRFFRFLFWILLDYSMIWISGKRSIGSVFRRELQIK